MGCCFGCLRGAEDVDGGPKRENSSLHKGMLRERQDNVLDKYEIVKRIGEGSMGSISMVRVKDSARGGSAFRQKRDGWLGKVSPKKTTGQVSEKRNVQVDYALKTILLSRVSPEFVKELRNEIYLLRQMDHPNIVKAYEVYARDYDIAIIMELNSGGDLYARIPYSEKAAATYTGQLLSAIKYMHSRNIVHRDLKFENIMFENESDDAQIKVIDFGLSKKFMPGEKKYMREGVGTIYTMAPQVLQGIYTSQADLWSVGVISYMLLSSEKPFHHKKRRYVVDKIMRCDYNFDSPIWDLITPEAQDFVSSLIVLNPKERLNATQALDHKWLSRDFKLSDRRPPEEVMKGIEASLLKYKDTSELKKVALNVIAHKSSSEEIVMLRKAFDQYDTSCDGYITYEEFGAALKDCEIDDATLHEMFQSIDVSQSGKIEYCEFLAAVIEARDNVEEERIADAFDHLDSSDTGFISKEDLRVALGKKSSPEQIKRLIDEADTDRDGQISFQEFMAIFRKKENELVQEAVVFDSSKEDSVSLVGLDAKIPGGKYDTARTGREEK